MTPAFINWLRSQTKAAVSKPPMVPSAVVHVRRGDVDPCKQWKDRYLPNAYYLDVLKQCVPKDVPVTVFSEAASFEPFSDFDSNITSTTFRLDTDVAEVWQAVMSASHVVLSKSSFAYVPALLNANNATIVYPANWSIVAMPGWKKVDPDIQERSLRRLKLLRKLRCGNYTSVRSGRSFYNATRRRPD
jgi:Glycosyl transferase family 11